MLSKNQIRVIVRVRPADSIQDCGNTDTAPKESVFDLIGSQSCAIGTHRFSFDRIFAPNTTQKQLFYTHFNEYVDNALDGFSSAIIAFGQTAAGKSFTMTGSAAPELEGAIPRAVRRLFENHAGSITASYVEIYNEKLLNLFDHRAPVTMLGDGSLKDTKTVRASSAAELLKQIDHGNLLRSTANTAMNSASSRSHAVLTLRLENSAKLMLVDLAGSEVVRKTGASGQVLTEAGSINKSLTSLAMVISALSQSTRPKHIPYRACKLTQLLQDAFGGESKTTLVINCSPLREHIAETVASLRFGARAKLVHNSLPNKEERVMCDALTALKAELENRLKSWRFKGPEPRSEWLEIDDLLMLLGRPAETVSISERLHAEAEELKMAETKVVEIEGASNALLEQEAAELGMTIEARRAAISAMASEIEDLTSKASGPRTREAASSLAELENVSMDIDAQSETNDRLRRQLAQIRAQSMYDRAVNYLKHLEMQIYECGTEIEHLSRIKRPLSSDTAQPKRQKTAASSFDI